MNRKGSTKMGMPEIIILGVMLLLAFKAGAFDFITGATEEAPEGGSQVLDGWCAVEDVSVTLDAVDKYNYATAATGSIFYLLNGDPLKAVADETVVTMSPGDELDVYFALNGTNHYTTVKENVVIPCKGSYTVRGDVSGNQTITVTAWNTNGVAMDDATNETMGKGDIKTFEFRIQGTFETAAPYGYKMVCGYNSTLYDGLDVQLDAGYGTATESTVPKQWTALTGTHKGVAWDIPALVSNDKIKGTITVDAGSSYNPVASFESAINCTLYDYDYFIKDDGTVGLGVEDTDDNSDVGDTELTTTAGKEVLSIWIA